MMKHTFDKDIDWFVKNIESRKRLLPTFAHVAGILTKEIHKDMDKFIDEHAYDKVYDEDGDLKEFGVPQDYSGRYRILSSTLQHSVIFANLLPKMTVVSLVSLFDAYLARLIRTFFDVKPQSLNSSEKNIRFSDLMEFENLDDAREHIISLEIETILRNSHTDQFKWLEDKLKLPLRELDAWKLFIEITERRNLFVHTDGIVNKQYITACKDVGYKLDDKLKKGDRLHVPPDYYKEACTCIAEIGVKLAQVMWRKMIPTDAADADNSLINVTYNFLLRRDYELALTLCKLCELPAIKNSCLENEYYLKINQAIALKGLERHEDMSSIIESVDWTVLTEKLQLAASVLKDEWEESARLMEKIGSTGDITKRQYHEWPLFRWFRKTIEFKEAYNKVFEEEYKIIGKTKEADLDESLNSNSGDVE